MDFNLPTELVAHLAELDEFIAKEIKPLEEQDDNIRFFDQIGRASCRERVSSPV